MSDHIIAAEDWPETKSLINRERSGQFTQGLGTSQGSRASTQIKFAILDGELESGSARASILMPSDRVVQDIFFPDGKPFKLVVGRDDSNSEKTQEIHASINGFELKSILEKTKLKGTIERIEEFEQRFKVVYNTRHPEYKLLADADQPRVFISENDLIKNGFRESVSFGLITSKKLQAGTLCQISIVPGRGWTITEFEELIEPEETIIINSDGEVQADPCKRQILPAGVSSDCPACGDDAPEGFVVEFIQASSPEFTKIIAEDDVEQDAAGVDITNHSENRRSLIHDARNVWQSDFFSNDSMSWKLEIFDNQTSGPAARLELIGEGETIYTEGLRIVYWSKDIFDCLSTTQLARVSHLSRGTSAMPRHEFPGCVTLRPFSTPCSDSGGSVVESWNCVPYWSVLVDGQEFVSGPPRDPEFPGEGDDCEWPAYGDSDDTMRVVYSRRIDDGGHFWTVEAEVVKGGETVSYRALQNSTDAPSCFGLNLTTEEDKEGFPSSITLVPWQK